MATIEKSMPRAGLKSCPSSSAEARAGLKSRPSNGKGYGVRTVTLTPTRSGSRPVNAAGPVTGQLALTHG